jgi:CubicO group peptidase (beta-lactamase class C family)
MLYKESDPAILVWAAEKVTNQRFAKVAQNRLWSKIGAEHELEAVCDPLGFWTHYVSCTARDLARWGQMLVDSGRCNEKTVVPSSFVQDIRDNAHFDLLRDEPFVGAYLPKGIGYRSFFYVDSHGENAIAAMGGYGQLCYMSPATKTVVVILSSSEPLAARVANGEDPDDAWQKAKAEEEERWNLCREICSTLSKR